VSILEDIRVEKIVPNPLQHRDDAGDLTSLVDSIKAIGLIEPVVVRLNKDGFTLMAGHRRVEAAKLAGLKKIPAIVHSTMDERTEAGMLLAENTVRRDLTAVEEANGIQTMLNVGWKEPGTAIGRSVDHVDRAVRVAHMAPELKKAAVQATMDEAFALAEFDGDKKAIKALTKALEAGNGPGFAWSVADLRRKRDHAVILEALKEKLKAEGIRVVKRDYMGGQRELEWLKDAKGDKFTAESHASCPGHAATISVNYDGTGCVTYVCTDSIAQHAANQGDAKADAKRAKAEAEKARIESEWATSSEVRIAFVRKMLRGKVPSGVMPWAFSVLCTTGDGYMYASAPRFEAVWGDKAGVATEKYAPGMIAALAAAHVESELDSITRYTYVRSAAAKKLYLELLMTEGYALSPVERVHYDDCVKELAGKPAVDEDDDCDQDCDACTHQCEDAS